MIKIIWETLQTLQEPQKVQWSAACSCRGSCVWDVWHHDWVQLKSHLY